MMARMCPRCDSGNVIEYDQFLVSRFLSLLEEPDKGKYICDDCGYVITKGADNGTLDGDCSV